MTSKLHFISEVLKWQCKCFYLASTGYSLDLRRRYIGTYYVTYTDPEFLVSRNKMYLFSLSLGTAFLPPSFFFFSFLKFILSLKLSQSNQLLFGTNLIPLIFYPSLWSTLLLFLSYVTELSLVILKLFQEKNKHARFNSCFYSCISLISYCSDSM